MPSEDDLRTRIRPRLRTAVRNRDRIAAATRRDAIAALDNAETVSAGEDLQSQSGQYVAGGVVGLGAAEVGRLGARRGVSTRDRKS